MAKNQPERDIEESDEELDTPESETVDFWEKKQRELVTSVVDYNLGTLADLVSSKAIDIAPKYQRRFRWDDERKSKLIESFLMNVPVPPIFLNEDSYGQYSVIDGKQRIIAISDFFKSKFRLSGLKLFSDINTHTFDDLPAKLQTVIRTRPTIRAVIILRQSDPDLKFEVFRRLNTGGVKLNAQEVRNSTYPGPLNDLILDLSENKQFHRLLNITTKHESAIYQEMRDAELVLRYFTFHKTWQTFPGGMMRQLDLFMKDNQRASKAELETLRTSFLSTLNVVEAAFDDHAFHRWMPERGAWRNQALAALYDAEMFACMGRDPSVAEKKRPKILEGIQKLCEDSDFRRTIDAATNTPALFRERITRMVALLDDLT